MKPKQNSKQIKQVKTLLTEGYTMPDIAEYLQIPISRVRFIKEKIK